MAGEPLAILIDAQDERIASRLRLGSFRTADEVVEAGLRALDREEGALDAILKKRIKEALADPRPPIAMEDVFERLERIYPLSDTSDA